MLFGESTNELYEALRSICRDFDGCAERSAKGWVFVPANISLREFKGLLRNPSIITSGNNGTEPCYPSLKAGNEGQDDDGSEHSGYVVVDATAREVVDLISRDGTSLLSTKVNTAGLHSGSKSKTVCLAPIVAALVKAEDIIGPDRSWSPVNEKQQSFLERIFNSKTRQDLSGLDEIQSIASFSAQEINAWLKDRGFIIELGEFSSDGEFGAASILDVLVEWMEEGARTTVTGSDGMFHDAVTISDRIVSFHTVEGHPNPVASVATKSAGEGNSVCMTMIDAVPSDEFEFLALIKTLERNVTLTHEYSTLTFPMVDLDQEVDISWLCGMNCQGQDNRPAIIGQALQQTKLKMNEKGAHAKSAAAMALTRGIGGPRPHVINKPFLIWIERKGLLPLFMGWITPADWKNPGGLSC